MPTLDSGWSQRPYLAPRDPHRLMLVSVADGRGLGSNKMSLAQAEMEEGQAGSVVTQASPGQGGTKPTPDVLPLSAEHQGQGLPLLLTP